MLDILQWALFSVLIFFFQGALFIVPSVPANALPSYTGLDKIPVFGKWKTPVNKDLFGPNKTWRGLFLGVLITLPIAFALCGLHAHGLLGNTYIPYSLFGQASPYIITVQMVAGALGGDMVKSVLKRHWAKVPAGEPWDPWDRVDFLLGTYFVMIWYPLWFGEWDKILLLALSLPIMWVLVFRGQRIINTFSFGKGWKSAI